MEGDRGAESWSWPGARDREKRICLRQLNRRERKRTHRDFSARGKESKASNAYQDIPHDRCFSHTEYRMPSFLIVESRGRRS